MYNLHSLSFVINFGTSWHLTLVRVDMGTSWHGYELCDKRCQLVPSSITCLVGYELTLVVRVDITCGTSWHPSVVWVDMGTNWQGYELTWGELTWVRVDCHPVLASTRLQQYALPDPQPSKHEALNQCWFDVGPASPTVKQNWTSIGSTSRVCWECWQDTLCFAHRWVWRY